MSEATVYFAQTVGLAIMLIALLGGILDSLTGEVLKETRRVWEEEPEPCEAGRDCPRCQHRRY